MQNISFNSKSIIKAVNGNVFSRFLFFLIISSNIYAVKIGFSPVYVLIPSLFLFAVMRGIHKSTYTRASFVIFLLLVFALATATEFNGSLANLICLALGFFTAVSEAAKVKTEDIFRTSYKSLYIVAGMLVIDSLYRLLNPGAPYAEMEQAIAGGENAYYLYKFNTLMFADSNTIALVALSWLCFILFLQDCGAHKNRILTIAFIFIILSSLSKAAIFGMFLILLLRISSKLPKIINLLPVVLLLLMLFSNFEAIFGQGSGFSKIDIFDQFIYTTKDMSSFDIIFGNGIGSSESILGIFGHNIFITYIIDLGIIGLFLLISFLVFYNIENPYYFSYGAAIIVTGLSYFFYEGSAFISIPLGIATVVGKRRVNYRKEDLFL
jgi:hypothetical protein